MLRSVSFIGLAILLSSRAALTQAPLTQPPARGFEVATVKPTDPAFGDPLIGFSVERFSAKGLTLKDLVGFAYDVDNHQVTGGPKWLDSDRYDIVAKRAIAASPNPDEARLMLQPLLADRFQLKIHRETRDIPVFVLTVGKNGLKMRPRIRGDGGATPRMVFQGARLPGRNISVQELAFGLQKMVLDRPVLDKTGLTGKYDFDLSWRPDPGQFRGKGSAVASDPDDPDIFTAIREQLGLKLDAQRGPAPVIVVDGPAKPSDN